MEQTYSKYVSLDLEGNQVVHVTRELIEEYAVATPETWKKWRKTCDDRALPEWLDITSAAVTYDHKGISKYLEISKLYHVMENDVICYKKGTVVLKTGRKVDLTIDKPIDW